MSFSSSRRKYVVPKKWSLLIKTAVVSLLKYVGYDGAGKKLFAWIKTEAIVLGPRPRLIFNFKRMKF